MTAPANDEEAVRQVRRRLLKAVIYAAPAVVTSLGLGSAFAGQGTPSCGPAACGPNTCGPNRCTPICSPNGGCNPSTCGPTGG